MQTFPMGFLGLSEPIEKQDNILQRLFWPGDHAGEVDSLGQQGFWICTVVGGVSSIALLVMGHWIIGVLTLIFFGLGGIGVREHSTAAAALVAVAYILNQISNVLAGLFPGFLAIVAAVLLIANIRGTWIAARWKKRGDPEVFPQRMSETWKDRLVDQMPASVWPKARIPFFLVSAVYMLIVVLGTVVLARGAAHPVAGTPVPRAIDVRPSQP